MTTTPNNIEEMVDNIDHIREDQNGTIFMEVKREDLIQAITDAEERGKRKILGNVVVQDFVHGMEDWYEQLLPDFKESQCVMCGIRPDKMKELATFLTPKQD